MDFGERKNNNDGINNKTYELLFGDINNLPEEEYGNYANVKAWATIDTFTRLEQKKIFCILLKLISKETLIDINNITYNNETKEYEYRHNDLVITFDMISKRIEGKDAIKELTSRNRYGNCHTMSMVLAQSIDNSRIVTGQCTLGMRRFLHTIIEYDLEDETYVLDWTRNLRTTKNQYIKLTKFKELSSIDAKVIFEDLEVIGGNLNINVKPYLVFRDEMMRDIQKNIGMFSITDEAKEIIDAHNKYNEGRKSR